MALAGARRPEEVNDLGAPDEVELGQGRDPISVERRLEAEVEAFERFDRQQLGRAQGDVDPARLAGRVFLAEQPVDRLDRGYLARLELPYGVIERLQRTRHLQADKGAADTVQKIGHDGAPVAARRRPTAS